MKTKRLNIRISERRSDKLRLYAALKDKTLTQIVEDWIDLIPEKDVTNAETTLGHLLVK